MKRVLLLLLLAVLTAPLDAQYRARWVTTGTQDGGGGEPALPLTAIESLSSSSTDQAATYASTDASFTEHAGATTFSCTTGALCLVWVTNTDTDAAGPDVPTAVTQTGQTWTLLTSVMETTPELRQSLYYTEGAGAAAAAITATFADAQNGAAFAVWEVQNVDLTAGTSGILQFNSRSATNAGSSMTGSASYTMQIALSGRNSGSAVLMGHANRQSCGTRVAEAGYTQGTGMSYATPTTRGRVDYVIDGPDTDPSVVLTGACSQSTIDWVGIAVEVSPDLSSDVTDPTVIITNPTIGNTYAVSEATFAFAGSSADNDDIDDVTWACATCTPTSGTATGDETWSATADLTCSAGAGTANTITVTATDLSANTSTDTIVVTCVSDDSLPPVVVVNNPPTLSTTSSNSLASFDGTVTDDGTVDRVSYSASGATPASGDATLLAGAWDFVLTVPCSAGGTTTTVNITAYDTADNASQTHMREYVCVESGGSGDVTDPTVTLTSAGGAVSSGLALFTGTAFDEVPGGVTLVTGYCTTCTPSTWQATGLTTWSRANITLASGANTLCAVSHDAAGNQSDPACQVWTYTAPVAFSSGGCVPAQEDGAYGGCTITVTGGDGTYTLTDLNTELNTGNCAGLAGSQVAQTFVISGVATATAPVTCEFTVRANDGVQAVVDKDYSILVQSAGGDPQAYWAQIQALPEAVASASRSLRNQTQLNALTGASESAGTGPWVAGVSPSTTPWWTYDFAADTHTEKQDAGKLSIPRLRPTYQCTTVYGKVIFSGTPTTVIPSGTVLTNPDTGYTYRTNGSATIGAGGTSAKTRIDVVTPTPMYLAEIPVGTDLDFNTPIPGVNDPVLIPTGEAVTARCADSINSNNQARIPIGLGGPTATSADSIILTWDVYYTRDWRTLSENKEWSQLKAYKPQFGATQFSPDSGWTLFTDFRFGQPAASPSNFASWSAFATLGGTSVGYNTNDPDERNLSPTGLGAYPLNTYQEHWGVWTRYWIEIKFKQPGTAFTEWGDVACVGPILPSLCTEVGGHLLPNPNTADGTYQMVSVWVADEDRNAELVQYRTPRAGSQQWVARLDLEFGVSDTGISRSLDLTAYVRNFQTLQNYTLGPNAHQTDGVLFQRPQR
jgi:hypothetical protein